jgi:hypothetical protein
VTPLNQVKGMTFRTPRFSDRTFEFVGKRLVNGFPPQARMSGLGCSRKRLPVMRKQFLDSVNRVLRDA